MYRIGTKIAGVAFVGAVVLAGSPAQAASNSTSAAALSCPSSGSICLYKDAGFLNITDVLSGSGSLSGSANDSTTAIRNRSGCDFRLYIAGSPTGAFKTISAKSEFSNIGSSWGSSWNDSISYVQIYC
ncbi:hypothetical protein [Micromonospora chokoriensis]